MEVEKPTPEENEVLVKIHAASVTFGDLASVRGDPFIVVLMVIPVVMVFLSLVLKHKANRWANIVIAIFFFIFNLIGLPTYPSAYDQFLIVVGLVLNVLTVWYAWKWVEKKDRGNDKGKILNDTLE